MNGHIATVSHQMHFWLKNSDSTENVLQLAQGIKANAFIETLCDTHISLPAATEVQEDVDNTYSASALLFCASVSDKRTCPTHPLHRQFITDDSYPWNGVTIRGSISIQ